MNLRKGLPALQLYTGRVLLTGSLPPANVAHLQARCGIQPVVAWEAGLGWIGVFLVLLNVNSVNRFGQDLTNSSRQYLGLSPPSLCFPRPTPPHGEHDYP